MASALFEMAGREVHGSPSPVDAKGGLSDEELLEKFLGPDEPASQAAFRVLVGRHGPMVLGVCRHVLDQIHDAEDAFQATFLVLARSAGSIRERRVLARWLYEVAYRIAIRARSRSVRRRMQEKEAAEMLAVGPRPESDPAWNELRPVLHDEVNRLPEKYRSAVVLCYLEGRTNEEAAAMLRWPVGTVKGRLSRARDLLRSRLTRRGLALSAAFLAVSLSKNAVFAEVVPPHLVEQATRAAVAVARGEEAAAAVSQTVLEMADDALKAQLTRKVPALIPSALGLLIIASTLAAIALVLIPGRGSQSSSYAATLFRAAIGWGDGQPSACCHGVDR
jgi:RNA polymerase sigma factor (sigma-70 family)